MNNDSSLSAKITSQWQGAVCLVIALPLLVFARTLQHDLLLWDDNTLITCNPLVTPASWSGMLSAWRVAYDYLYIPLTYNLWMILGWLGGGKNPHPAIFHGANVAMHIGNSLLVLAICRKLTGKIWPSCLAALLFGLHPLQVESVAWASGMKDLLSGALALGAILGYLRAATAARPKYTYLLAIGLLFLSTLAKPGVVGVPLMIMAMDWLLLRRRGGVVLRWGIPLLLVVIPAILWTRQIQPVAGFTPPPVALRPAVAADALAFYIQKAFYPLQLCTDYGLKPDIVLTSGRALWSWLIPAGVVLAIGIIPKLRRPGVLAGGLIFVAGVLPVLGLIPFGFQYYSTVADRYVYLSMLVAALILVDILTLLPGRQQMLLGGALILILGALSHRQCGFWANTVALETHTVSVNPHSAAAYTRLAAELGVALKPEAANRAKLRQQARELQQLAENYCRKALAVQGDYLPAQNNLVALLLMQGRDREARELARRFQVLAEQKTVAKKDLAPKQNFTSPNRS